MTPRARQLLAAGPLVFLLSASGCSTRAASCSCFQRLLEEAGCSAHGGTELGFPAARQFRGRFASPGAMAGARVAVQAESGGPVRLLSTDPAGGFDAGPLEAGAYRFVVCRPGMPGASGWVAVSPTAPETPLELELPY